MLGTKNNLFVDRKVYNFRGKWCNPNNDFKENIFYFISVPMTLASRWQDGREEIKSTMEITVFGEHAFCKHDIIYLQDGTKFEIGDFVNNYFESNIQVRDLLKQKVESQAVTLE